MRKSAKNKSTKEAEIIKIGKYNFVPIINKVSKIRVPK